LRHIDIDDEDYRQLKDGAAELRRVGARWLRHAAEIGKSDVTLSNLMAREAAVALDVATRLEEVLEQ
jgi:plasmid maintenance system antidote protein VapI